ncbi:MAG: glycosyl transferase, partial [Myxococcales bacterium]|nr:glycosyl transferase [Myxococcales bacterium]
MLTLLPLVRVASTHRIFSATADEPVHIASGYDWITRGVYVFDPEHPPLARGLFGLGLRAGGVVSPPPEDWQTLQPTWLAAARGMDLLWHDGQYARNLANARRGNLVFLLIALIAVAAWAWRAFGPGVAVLAVALFGSLPPVLAHAGLATTDMAVAATLPLALLALERWLE